MPLSLSQQSPDIQALLSQFLAHLQLTQLEQFDARKSDGYPDIRTEVRTHVDTNDAAYLLLKRPQTLRGWACHEDGPLRPIRINGRLAWPVAEIRRLLGVAA